MPTLPCFLCGRQLPERMSKRGKPYFVCDFDGVQIFVRRQQGIQSVEELMRTLRGRDLPFREHAQSLYKIRALLTEMRGVKKEIDALKRESGWFKKDKHKLRAQKLLRVRLQRLLKELEQIARNS